MPVLYYYKDYINDDEETVKEYIASLQKSKQYIENNVYVIDDFWELKQWCSEFHYELDELYELFGIDLKEWL